MSVIRRREFITLLGGAAAAWPLAASAQQPAMPVIGFLDATSPDVNAERLRGISPGPEGSGISSRARTWRSNTAGRKVNSIGCRHWRPIWFAGGSPCSPPPETPAALAAKAATTTIPIVFPVGDDPVKAWPCRQPRPARRQRDRHQFLQRLSWRQNGWSSCASWCPQPLGWPCSSIRPIATLGDHVERGGNGGSRHGDANPSPQRQHHRRDQCGLRNFCARAARRAFRRPRPLLQHPAGSIGSTWRRATGSPRHIRCVTMPKPAG